MPITDVANALRQQNLELPAGSVNAGRQRAYGAHAGPPGRIPAQFNEIAVAARGPYLVKMRDIGHAED